MVRLRESEYSMVLNSLDAPLRNRLYQVAVAHADIIQVGDDDVAGDVYDAIMEYVVMHEFDKDHNVTAKGRELERIADSIFDQSEG